MRPFLGSQRSNPTPLQLEGLKMAEGGRMERRRIALALAVTVPVVVLCYFWASLHLGYRWAWGTGNTDVWLLREAGDHIRELDAALRYPSGADASGTLAMGFGAVVTLLLLVLKLRLPWWPCTRWRIPSGILPPSIDDPGHSHHLAIQGLPAALRWSARSPHALPFFLGLLAGSAVTATLQRLLFMAMGL